MLSRTPTNAIVMLSDVPPSLKKGSGRPVVGSKPVTTPMLMNACTEMSPVIPAASRQPNLSGQVTATRIPAG